MKKILITGGSGFIGKNLAGYLKQKGFALECPSSKEFDVLKYQDIERWKENKIDHTIHLAGKTFVPDSWEDYEQFFEVNVLGTLRVIEFCKELGIGMTYISAYVYGQVKNNPVTEETEVKPDNPYAKSKYIAEDLCKFFCEYLGTDISVLRLFNVYGSGQSEKFLVPSIVKQVLGNTNVVRVQNLTPKRDYIYIEDVCRAIEMSIYKTKGYHLFNVGSGVSYSVSEVIRMVQKIAGTDKQVISADNIRKNEIDDTVAGIGKIQREWGWRPAVSLEDGLKKYMEALYE